MKENPIITAVRKARKKISAQHGNNLKKLVAHYQEMERHYGGKIYSHRVLRKAV